MSTEEHEGSHPNETFARIDQKLEDCRKQLRDLNRMIDSLRKSVSWKFVALSCSIVEQHTLSTFFKEPTMALVGIDSSKDESFSPKNFDPLPKGVYTFEVTGQKGGPLCVTGAKSSGNNIINVELHCIDDGPHKGALVFDCIVLTPKAEFKLVHLALASGKYTADQLKSSKDASGHSLVDTSLLDHSIVRASIDIEAPKQIPDPSTGGLKTVNARNRVVSYLFDAGADAGAADSTATT